MGHGIKANDEVFTVRKPAWHFGETGHHVFEEYPTREEAQAVAHPWEPITEPVYRRVPQVAENGELVEHYEEIEGSMAVVRSDDGTTLGVTSDERPVLNNSEMYDIAEAIEGGDPGSVMFETGGSLDGGRKVWLLLRLRDPLVIAGDPHGQVIPYYALQDHKVLGGFRGQATLTKIVCQNTSQMADWDAQQRGTEMVFKHTSSLRERIEAAKNALAGWRESIEAYQRMAEHMVTQTVTPAQREWFIEEFVPMPPPHMVSARVETNVRTARQQMRDILASVTCEGIDLTTYGLVQAAVEYNNHYRRANSAENRFKRAYLERSKITADAVELAQLAASAVAP